MHSLLVYLGALVIGAGALDSLAPGWFDFGWRDGLVLGGAIIVLVLLHFSYVHQPAGRVTSLPRHAVGLVLAFEAEDGPGEQPGLANRRLAKWLADNAHSFSLVLVQEAILWALRERPDFFFAENAAGRHLAIYRPNVVVVDLGLPDGDGMALIRHLAAASTPIDAIVALSGYDRADWQGEAIEAGAAACLQKPIESLRAFQECILGVLPDAETRKAMLATGMEHGMEDSYSRLERLL